MTQQEMADRLGLSSPYIAQIESGFKPPPPESIVEKMARIMQLGFEEKRIFSESAETERELQSLVKATRKIGYVLAGNKVCVPQKAISFRTQHEIDALVETIPKETEFVIDLLEPERKKWYSEERAGGLRTLDDLRSWALSELGDQPSVWLTFLGQLHDVILLTPDGRLLCRQPSDRRQEIVKHAREVGLFFKLFRSIIEAAKALAAEQKLPDVIAPHEAWKKIDQTLGAAKSKQQNLSADSGENGAIRNIPIVSIIQPGSEELEHQEALGNLGLPRTWFSLNAEYEAFFVQSDAYLALGVWPGVKAVYELNSQIENEDLAVVQIGDRRYVRKYFDLGEEMLLQGGPMAKPIRVSKAESSVRVIGVVRELVSRFKDIKQH
jgi:transcriptional regulator with XRE-family HTH domain/SOS-response transcriptional repressor LexA